MAANSTEQPRPCPAGGGELTPAGLPSPAALRAAPAATGVSGFSDAGGAGSFAGVSQALLIEAAKRRLIINPLIAGEIKGRAAMEQHARAHGTTAATLYRWCAAWKRGGDAALVDKARLDKGQARVLISAPWEAFMRGAGVPREQMLAIADELVRVVRGLWAQQGKSSWHQVAILAEPVLVRLTCAAAGCDEAVAQRCSRLMRRFVEGERRFGLVAIKDRDGKAFYDRTPSIKRSRAHLMPGDCVFGDVSPADIPVLRPDGTVAWARLIAWMDAATNMMHITGHLANKGGGVRREHVALSFAAMCAQAPWGMPKRLYLDNGSEYKWQEMLDAWAQMTRLTQGVFAGVWEPNAAREQYGVVTRSVPFKPRAKLIEGAFGNLLNIMGWHPSFAGSDRMRKKVATLGQGLKPVPVADLKGFLGQAVACFHSIEQEGHLQGQSPAQRMAEFLAQGFVPTQANAEALAFAFAETHECRVRMGRVQVGGMEYQAKELVAWDGERLTVRWPRHAPDAAWCFKGQQLVAMATPTPVFAWGDQAGARHAARIASEAREVVEVMRGQVAWLDPRDLMGEVARLARVDLVVDEAARRARRIELTPEAQAITEARKAQLLAALDKCQPVDRELIANRHALVDEEADAFRIWLDGGDDDAINKERTAA